MGHRTTSPDVRNGRRRRAGRHAAALGIMAIVAAGCGSAGSRLSVGTPPTSAAARGSTTTSPTASGGAAPTTTAPEAGASTTTAPSTTTTAPSPTTTAPSGSTTTPPAGTTPGCSAAQLAVNQVPLSEGTGEYYLAWSRTDSASTACVVAAGQPTLSLRDAAGRSVVTYVTTAGAAGATTPLVVQPGRAVWFLTEELSTACPAPATVTGGPFRYTITLPGGTGSVTWTPSYLSGATLGDLCTKVPISIGGLQATKPSA